MNLPDKVNIILDKLNKNGYEAYVVGGCVRDYLMGLEPHDYDITTSALPEQVKKLFSHTVDTGIQHGTVTIVFGKECYEVTTFRIDGEYKDNRHPESVIFTDKLKGDLSRRDFTVNAIAYSPSAGFVDLFGGMEDIKGRIIRGVGEPAKRFQEDALRMMRALRFSAQLDFTIERETLRAVRENAALIKNISVERIREEFFRLIMSVHNERLALLYDSELPSYFMPELNDILSSVDIDFYRTLNCLSHNISLRLAFLMRGLGKEQVERLLHNFRTDNKTIKLTALLIANTDYEISDEYSMRKLINISGDDIEIMLEYICAVQRKNIDMPLALYRQVKRDCCSIRELALGGRELQELGVTGKKTGELLKLCLEYVMKEPSKNSRELLIDYVRGLI